MTKKIEIMNAHVEQHPFVADGLVRDLVAEDDVALVVVGGPDVIAFDRHDLGHARAVL